MNLLELATSLDKRADELPLKVARIKQAVARELIEALIYATPVDTSTAVSNWVVSVGSPATSYINAHSLGFNGSTFTASARQALSLAEAIILQGGPGRPLWISNNAPYIMDLNNGSSRQAPSMFIEKKVSEVRSRVQQIAQKVLNDR